MATTSESTRRSTRSRLWLIAGTAAVAVGAGVLIWFQPQKLLQDKRVNEAAPPAMATEPEPDATGKRSRVGLPKMGRPLDGSFRSIAHTTGGTATLSMADDGRYYLRLEDFSTENGPDLFVYLSSAPASADGREYAEDFVDLGPLKGNIGNQNYLVPEGTDVDNYRSVVIWCRRFTTAFGSAPLG